MADTTERNFRKVRRGYVVSEAMDKTITVELEQRSTHPLYGKVVPTPCTVSSACAASAFARRPTAASCPESLSPVGKHRR